MPGAVFTNDNDLKKYLNIMIDKILELNPQLQLSKNNRDLIVDSMFDHLQKNKDGQNVSVDQIKKPDFLQKMILCVTAPSALATINDGKKITDDRGNPFKLIDEIKKILFSKDRDSTKEMKLTLEDKKKINKLMEKLYKELDKLAPELKKAGIKFPEPKPGKGKKNDKEEEQEFDANVGLLGLVSSRISGVYPFIIQVRLGNLMAITDQNPYKGTATIEDQNDPDTGYGLSQRAVTNFIGAGASDDALQADERMLGENSSASTSAPGPSSQQTAVDEFIDNFFDQVDLISRVHKLVR